MPGISYDDSGSLANYFGVTFLACALIPYTYAVFKPAKRDPLKPQCSCSKCTTHLHTVQTQAASARRRKFSRRIIPLLLGWLAFGYMAHRISVAPQLPGAAVYNPFEILGISSSLDEKAIKKHYKRLSLQYHPDKITLGPNETMEQVEDKFVELTKAYKSLTDDVIRENLAKYGNPDGPQQREDKIAIPQWVVEGKNSIWVLVAYGLLLGGGIPWVVGRWWFRQRRTTRDNVLNGSAEYYFHSLRDDTDFITLITIFAGAKEFAQLLDPKSASNGKMAKKARKEVYTQVESLETTLDSLRASLGIEVSATLKKESRVQIESAGQRKARALLWAHLLRYDLGDKSLKEDQRKMLEMAPPLLQSLANISQAHGWLKTSLLCLRLQQALAQAVALGFTPVAQLPGVGMEEAERMAVEGGWEGERWLDRLVSETKGEKKGEKVEKGQGEEKVQLAQEAKEVAKGWYKLDVVSADFKVEGETVVPPSSIVNLVIKVRYVHPGSIPGAAQEVKDLPNGDAHEEKENGEVEDTDKAEDGMVEKVREKTLELVGAGNEQEGGKGKEKVWEKNGYAHAPYWPTLRKPHYHVLLGDSKLDKVIVPPIRITDIPAPSSPSSSSSASASSETREFKLTFPAPPQPNLYSFILHLVSDTSLGSDVSLPVMMKVEEPPQITEINGMNGDEHDEDDDGISDPEEDTLAGQMALMKGGRVKRSVVRNEYESSEEEESDTDGEGGEGESSDEEQGEGERRVRGREGKAINEDTDSEEE